MDMCALKGLVYKPCKWVLLKKKKKPALTNWNYFSKCEDASHKRIKK